MCWVLPWVKVTSDSEFLMCFGVEVEPCAGMCWMQTLWRLILMPPIMLVAVGVEQEPKTCISKVSNQWGLDRLVIADATNEGSWRSLIP